MQNAAHEAAVHRERLRVELAQSKTEQREYLRNVEMARVFKKRDEKRRAKGDDAPQVPRKRKELEPDAQPTMQHKKRQKTVPTPETGIDSVLSSIF